MKNISKKFNIAHLIINLFIMIRLSSVGPVKSI